MSITGILLVVAQPVWAGPFGLFEGQPASSLGTQWDEDGRGGFVDVRQPHPLFSHYEAFGTEATGLCALRLRAPARTPAAVEALASRVDQMLRAYQGRTPVWLGPTTDTSDAGLAARRERASAMTDAFWQEERSALPDARPWGSGPMFQVISRMPHSKWGRM